MFVVLCLLLTLIACNSSSNAKSNSKPLRLGLHVIRSVVPFWVAREKDYFSQEGANIEFVCFESAIDMDIAFQNKMIDAMLTDLVGAVLLKGNGEKLRIIPSIVEGGLNEGRVAILASPQSSIFKPADLCGKRLGLSYNTIVDFAVDKLFEEAGLSSKDVRKVSIHKMYVRLKKLLEGSIDAAVLAEPLITIAQKGGGRVILGKAHKEYEKAIKVMSCSKWDIPIEDQIDQVALWLKEKGAIKKDVDYHSLVDKDFVR